MEMGRGATPKNSDRVFLEVLTCVEEGGGGGKGRKEEFLVGGEVNLLRVKRKREEGVVLRLGGTGGEAGGRGASGRRFLDAQVHVRVQLVKKEVGLGGGEGGEWGGMGVVRVSVIQVKGLGGALSSCSWVGVKVRLGEGVKRTRGVRKTNNPIFYEHFEFPIYGGVGGGQGGPVTGQSGGWKVDGEPVIYFQLVGGEGKGEGEGGGEWGENEVIGGVSSMSFVLGDFLESIEVVEQPIQEKWCAFEDPVVVGGAEEGRDAGGDEGTSTPMGGGSLSLEAKWKVTRILGTVMYNQLSTLLFHSSPTFPALRVLDQALPSEQREAFASSLIPLLFQERQLLPFFHHLSHHEISQLSEPSVLFRGNTLTTKSMDQLQRFVCRRYLCDALHSWLMDLYEEKYSLEVDPRRLPPSVAQNPTTMAFQRALLLHQVGYISLYISCVKYRRQITSTPFSC